MSNLCPHCSAPLAPEDRSPDCPSCKKPLPSQLATLDLPNGTLDAMLPAGAGRGDLPSVTGYEVLEVLGQGGMGLVCKARQIALDRIIALKLLRPGLEGEDHSRERFRSEAEAMARLNHPGIVHVHEVGEHDGVPYFSMEYVAGGSLADQLRAGPLPFRTAAVLVEQLARAVFAAHEQGVIHRDLKPANVLLASVGQAASLSHDAAGQASCLSYEPKITDFGLARQLADDSRRTQAGAILGTPSYMAPEQARGEVSEGSRVGKRADVYSLGAILYECLTGRPPFLGETILSTLSQVLDQDPVPPSRLRPGCPRDLETICLRCLHKAPQRRYVSALSLANDLGHFLAGEPIIARPVGAVERAAKWARRQPALAALLAVAVLSLLGCLAGAGYLAHVSENNRKRERALRLAAEGAWQSEQQQRLEVEKARQQAEAAHAAAEAGRQREHGLRSVSERALYFNRIAYAERELGTFNVTRASELLDACPAALRRWEWGHLERRCQGSQMALSLGMGPIGELTEEGAMKALGRFLGSGPGGFTLNHLAHSPNGLVLAVARGNVLDAASRGDVELRDPASLQVVRTLQGFAGAAIKTSFRPDGKQLATISGTFDLVSLMTKGGKLESVITGEACLWDLATCTVVERWPRISVVAWSKDGKLLATGGLDGRVIVRDIATDKVLLRSLPQPGMLGKMRFSADGRWLMAGWQQVNLPTPGRPPISPDDIYQFGVSMWDVSTGKVAFERPGATTFAFSPENDQLAVGTKRGVIELWDPAARRQTGELRGHRQAITCLAHRPRSRGERPLLLSGSMDRSIRLWDRDSKRMVQVLLGQTTTPASVVFSPDGTRVLAVGQSAVLRWWELTTSAGIREMPGPVQPSNPPVFSPDGKLLFVPGMESVHGFDLATGKRLMLPAGLRRSVVVAPRANLLAAIAGQDVHLFDVRKLSSASQAAPLRRVRVKGAPLVLEITPQGDRLFAAVGALGQLDSPVALSALDPEKGKELWRSNDPIPRVALASSPDGKHLAALTIAGSVHVLDARSGATVRELHRGAPSAGSLVAALGSVVYSPDGKHIAATPTTTLGGIEEHAIFVWEAITGKVHARLGGQEGNVTGLAWSPDGQRLAASILELNRGTAGDVKLYDTSDWTEVLKLPGQRGVAFSADGRQLAGVGFEAVTAPVVRVWEALPAGPAAPLRTSSQQGR